MKEAIETHPDATLLVEFWKRRYRRQRQLIGAVTSLLSRYGSTVSTEELHRAFLLTLMGHFAVTDAALYAPTGDGRALEPALAYGRVPKQSLPVLAFEDEAVAGLAERRKVGPLRARASEAEQNSPLVELGRHYRMLAPLSLKNKLLGLVFLGPRVNGQPYSDFDVTLLDSLASVSAATFNDALLYRNARLSAEELKKLLEVRSDVISRISHEFRTPLTVLRAGIEMLPDIEPRVWMSESIDRLEELIESLLALGNESPAGDPQETNPLAAIHEAVGAVAAVAAQRRIRVSVSCSEAAQGLTASLPPEALSVMLRALLDNALAYSPDGSSVTVHADVVSGAHDPARDGIRLPEWVASTRDRIAEFAGIHDSLESVQSSMVPAQGAAVHDDAAPRHIVIRVADEGIGIPADEIVLVAEPFHQASNCPNRGVKGKGLGLALVRRRAEANGGFLCCRSALGAGTTVSLFLPST